MFFRILSIAALLGIVSTVNAQYGLSDIPKLLWLEGSWKGMHQGKPFYEAWRKANDSTLHNFSIEIKGTDTLVKEAGRIVLKGSDIWFSDGTAAWKLRRLNAAEMVFENDTLRYSNRIIWFRTSDDHWLTLLQHPRATQHYDIVRIPELEAVVNRFLAQKR